MEVHFNPEWQAKLEKLASDGGIGTDEYVRRLVEHYLDQEAWLQQKLQNSIEQLDQGKFLTHEEVGARLKAKFQS